MSTSRSTDAANDIRSRFACPVCGDTEHPKFDDTSAWCVQCVTVELLDQDAEDSDEIVPEVFG